MATRPRPLYGCHPRQMVVVALFALAVLAAGCSEQGSAERLPADAPILIEASSMGVMLENRAGLALSDVSIAIVPYGPTEFTKLVPRIENSAKRQISLSEFRSREGTSFSLRVARPKAVRLRARDTAGKSYDIEVPWN